MSTLLLLLAIFVVGWPGHLGQPLETIGDAAALAAGLIVVSRHVVSAGRAHDGVGSVGLLWAEFLAATVLVGLAIYRLARMLQ